MKNSDIHITSASVYFLPVTMRVPLKFGPETVTSAVCLRVKVSVQDRNGRTAEAHRSIRAREAYVERH